MCNCYAAKSINVYYQKERSIFSFFPLKKPKKREIGYFKTDIDISEFIEELVNCLNLVDNVTTKHVDGFPIKEESEERTLYLSYVFYNLHFAGPGKERYDIEIRPNKVPSYTHQSVKELLAVCMNEYKPQKD